MLLPLKSKTDLMLTSREPECQYLSGALQAILFVTWSFDFPGRIVGNSIQNIKPRRVKKMFKYMPITHTSYN